MKIQLKLYGDLRRLSPGGKAGAPMEIELPDSAILQELIDYLQVPAEETKVAFVNGIVQEWTYELKPGDQVGLFPPVGGGSSQEIIVEVLLYGDLAYYGGQAKQYGHAHLHLPLPPGSTLQDLLVQLEMPSEARGVTFINSKLSAMPGLPADLGIRLNSGDRVAFFHPLSMWPYQYRSGVPMTDELMAAMLANKDQGIHHSYK
jgi:molybdopterin synthase sulfur carrier subunit